MTIGHSLDEMDEILRTLKGYKVEDAAKALAKIKNISVDDALRFLGGGDYARGVQSSMLKGIGEVGSKQPVKKAIARMAGSKLAKNALRVVLGISGALVLGDVADVVTNDTSLANKAMDTVAMGIGGAIGSLAGPVGAMGGASAGKMLSDGTQWLLGDKKTPEQRRMEEALRALQSRGLI